MSSDPLPSVHSQLRWSISAVLIPSLAAIVAAGITAGALIFVSDSIQTKLLENEVRRELTDGLVRTTYRALVKADDLQTISGSSFPTAQKEQIVEDFNRAEGDWKVEIDTVLVVVENYYGPTPFQHNAYLVDKLGRLKRIVEDHLICVKQAHAATAPLGSCGDPKLAIDSELGLITEQMYIFDSKANRGNSQSAD